MKNKNKDKKDKKKLLVLALLLFMLIGASGYGVYSYFWTQGSFSGTSNSVSVVSFDPRTIIDHDDFLGDGGAIVLTCPSTSKNETVDCHGSVTVSNNGGSDIEVEVSDGTSGTYDSHNISASPSSPSFDWTEKKQIAAGGSETLNITVPVSVSSDFGSVSAIERNSSYDGHKESYVYITVGFKLKATQVHD